MNHLSVGEVLARANAALVDPDLDVTGAIASLLAGANQALPADAAAVLVESDGALDLLAATSHRVADLEIHQAQTEEGPCIDTIRLSSDVDVTGAHAIEEQWPVTGAVIVRSGYASVHATPLTWRGTTFGGLNLFRSDEISFGDQLEECRALADAVTLTIVGRYLGQSHVADGLRAALEERAVVEQAKGALAYLQSLDMAAAYESLLAMAEEDGIPLGVAARRVMEWAQRGAPRESSTGG